MQLTLTKEQMKKLKLTKEEIKMFKRKLKFQDRICKEMCPLKEGNNACPMNCCILNRNKIVPVWDINYWIPS